MKYNKLSDYQIKKILQNFCLELTATQTAKQLEINRHAADRYYRLLRERIAKYQDQNL